MDNKTRDLIKKLMIKSITEKEFLDKLDIDISLLSKYIKELLETTFSEKNPHDVEFLLFVGFTFDLFSEDYINVLCKLFEEKWHYRHEDIAGIFQDLKSPKAIECLYKTALTKFKYLEYNDSSALAIKCIWALWAINTPEACIKLGMLAESDDEIIRKCAIEKLEMLAKSDNKIIKKCAVEKLNKMK